MISIKTNINVAPDGKATIELSSNILPGGYKVLLVIDEQSIGKQSVVDYNSAWDEFEQLIEQFTVDS